MNKQINESLKGRNVRVAIAQVLLHRSDFTGQILAQRTLNLSEPLHSPSVKVGLHFLPLSAEVSCG